MNFKIYLKNTVSDSESDDDQDEKDETAAEIDDNERRIKDCITQ